MTKPPKNADQYSDDEAKERAEQALRGAFKTPPLPKRERVSGPPVSKDKRADQAD